MPAEFVNYMSHVLNALRAAGGVAKPRDVYDWVAKEIKLPEEKRWQRDTRGNIHFQNQVQWARQHLFWSGLIDGSQRNRWALTSEGTNAHLDLEKSERIVRQNVQNAHERQLDKPKQILQAIEQQEVSESPDEVEENKILDVLQALDATTFEHFCKRLLYECGLERLHVTGRPHDAGIDGHGLLRLSPFVTIKVAFQCKRYKGVVGGSALRDFRGAMQGRAEKGIFITTGHFSPDAEKEANRDGAMPIELVDGERLVEIMASKQIGVIRRETFDINQTFFEQLRS